MQKTFIILVLLSFAFVTGAAHANAAWEGVYEIDRCHAQFVLQIAQDYQNIGGIQNLSDKITALGDSLQQLQLLVDKPQDYHDYKVQNYMHSMNILSNAIRSARQDVNSSIRIQILADMINYSYQMNACLGDAYATIANQKIDDYTAILDDYQQQVDRLAAKNISTEGMNKVISDARNMVNDMKTALANANTTKQKRYVIQTYCLADACVIGISGHPVSNQHFFAKFAVTKLRAILSNLEPSAMQMNLTSDIQAIKNDLSRAQSNIGEAGNGRYNEGQRSLIWRSIRDAEQKLRVLLSKMK